MCSMYKGWDFFNIFSLGVDFFCVFGVLGDDCVVVEDVVRL